MPWEIPRSSQPIIELLPLVIRRSTVQKNCQKGVNTRENGSCLCGLHIFHDAYAQWQSIVLWRNFSGCSLLLLELSQTCSQLIHTRVVVVLASWLETRNQLQKRQEKNEFNFEFRQKNFLDRQNEARVSIKTKWYIPFFSIRSARFGTTRQTSLLTANDPELTELASARNFPPLRAESKAHQVLDAGNRYRYLRACFDGRNSFEAADDPPISSDWRDCFFYVFRTIRADRR